MINGLKIEDSKGLQLFPPCDLRVCFESPPKGRAPPPAAPPMLEYSSPAARQGRLALPFPTRSKALSQQNNYLDRDFCLKNIKKPTPKNPKA